MIKNTNYIKTFLFMAIGMVALSTVSCKKDDNDGNNPGLGSTPLNELIKQDTSLSIFSAILTRSHLDIYPTGSGPYTMFAPTNAAYRQQGIASANDVAALDSTLLLNKTAFLIAPGIKSSYYLVGLNVPINTALNYSTTGGVVTTPVLSASALEDSTYFNGYAARKRDIMASNGVLHVMNNCMLPTSNTTSVTLGLYPEKYKLFSQAIARATSGATVVNTSTTTVFAPTNEAMIAAGYDSLKITQTTAANLAILVKYHTITTRYYVFALKSGDIKTAQGKTVTLNMSGAVPTVKGASNTTASKFLNFNLSTVGTPLSTITSTNITTTNGTIHTIDQVLLP